MRLAVALLVLLVAAASHALTPEPGDVYLLALVESGLEVHHLDRDSGATTLVARDGFLLDFYTDALAVGPDGSVWIAHERENLSTPGRLVRIDPTAFDPGDPGANQTLVLDGGALLDDVSDIATLPAPVVGSVAAVPPWFAGAAGMLMLFAGVRARRRNGITKPAGGC